VRSACVDATGGMSGLAPPAGIQIRLSFAMERIKLWYFAMLARIPTPSWLQFVAVVFGVVVAKLLSRARCKRRFANCRAAVSEPVNFGCRWPLLEEH
jgi:hypothetical protein